MPLSLNQLDALQGVAHTASFALAAAVGLADEPDNERQQRVARDAQHELSVAKRKAMALGLINAQIDQIQADAQHRLAAEWQTSEFGFQRAAGAVAANLIR